jgi:hypothetical protein
MGKRCGQNGFKPYVLHFIGRYFHSAVCQSLSIDIYYPHPRRGSSKKYDCHKCWVVTKYYIDCIPYLVYMNGCNFLKATDNSRDRINSERIYFRPPRRFAVSKCCHAQKEPELNTYILLRESYTTTFQLLPCCQ